MTFKSYWLSVFSGIVFVRTCNICPGCVVRVIVCSYSKLRRHWLTKDPPQRPAAACAQYALSAVKSGVVFLSFKSKENSARNSAIFMLCKRSGNTTHLRFLSEWIHCDFLHICKWKTIYDPCSSAPLTVDPILTNLEEWFPRTRHFWFHPTAPLPCLVACTSSIASVLTGSIPVFMFAFLLIKSPFFVNLLAKNAWCMPAIWCSPPFIWA